MIWTMIRRLFALYILALALPVLAACGTNPATGKQSFTAFMSRSAEMQVGAEAPTPLGWKSKQTAHRLQATSPHLRA